MAKLNMKNRILLLDSKTSFRNNPHTYAKHERIKEMNSYSTAQKSSVSINHLNNLSTHGDFKIYSIIHNYKAVRS